MRGRAPHPEGGTASGALGRVVNTAASYDAVRAASFVALALAGVSAIAALGYDLAVRDTWNGPLGLGSVSIWTGLAATVLAGGLLVARRGHRYPALGALAVAGATLVYWIGVLRDVLRTT